MGFVNMIRISTITKSLSTEKLVRTDENVTCSKLFRSEAKMLYCLFLEFFWASLVEFFRVSVVSCRFAFCKFCSITFQQTSLLSCILARTSLLSVAHRSLYFSPSYKLTLVRFRTFFSP